MHCSIRYALQCTRFYFPHLQCTEMCITLHCKSRCQETSLNLCFKLQLVIFTSLYFCFGVVSSLKKQTVVNSLKDLPTDRKGAREDVVLQQVFQQTNLNASATIINPRLVHLTLVTWYCMFDRNYIFPFYVSKNDSSMCLNKLQATWDYEMASAIRLDLGNILRPMFW